MLDLGATCWHHYTVRRIEILFIAYLSYGCNGVTRLEQFSIWWNLFVTDEGNKEELQMRFLVRFFWC